MKSKESPEINQIIVEMLKSDFTLSVQALHHIFIKIWENEHFPEHWIYSG